MSVWSKSLEEHTSYKSNELKNCSEAYCALTQLILKSDKRVIVEKYGRTENNEVMRIIRAAFVTDKGAKHAEKDK
jgi:hypothetical protein